MLVRILLAAAAALFVSVPASAETWYRADTDNFIVYSTGRQDDLRDWAVKLERFDALLRLRYRIPSTPSPNRLTVYLLDDTKAVMEAMSGRKYGSVAGFYSDQIDGSYAVAHRTQGRRDDLNAQQVLFHEYGHHFMFRYFPFAYPGWYREGFAEYYAPTEIDEDGNWTYGKPPLYRGAELTSSRRQLSVERMLTMEQGDLSPEESYEVYTRGWLLVHMLHSDAERGRQLNDFLLAVAQGKDRAEAARSAFGDLGELDRDLDRYMRESPTYIKGREPIAYNGRLGIVALDEIDSEYEELRLANRRSHGREATRDRLQKLAERAPDRPHIWNALADTHHMVAHDAAMKAAREAAGKEAEDEDIEAGPADMTRALAAIERALALEPDNVRANALKAEFLIDVAQHSKDAATRAQARSSAIRANRVNPDNPMPLYMYYRSFAGERSVPADARAALARAFELAPEVNQLRVDYALDLAVQGKFEEAIDVVEFLSASPHSKNAGKLALKQIEALRQGIPYDEAVEIDLSKEERGDDKEGD